MNAITYFKLKSPFDGDVTKNCALTGLEVDNNFYTLEGRDIKSLALEDGRIVISLMNGGTLSTDSITDGCLRDLSVEFDEHEGVLRITKNGTVQEIGGFVTHYNQHEAIATDGSLTGKGLVNSPSGISPVYKTGQYRPVKRIIDVTEGESLPSRESVLPGDRFLTVENVSEHGYLYNYKGLKKIACRLAETHSEWRVPTKDDWDDMLNAVEPNGRFKNHEDARSNKFLGRFAGKLLKSVNCWEEEDTDGCTCEGDAPSGEICNCGKDIECHPSYCGEYGTCHHRHSADNSGIDKFCFSVVPAGYANDAKDYLYFGERAYFWTASNHEYRDAYIKAFTFNKSSVLQDILASDNYLSVRLVKDYTGDNFNEREEILGDSYSTVLMPSVKNGQAIWTSVNMGILDCECDCHCEYVIPNGGEGINFIKKYFTNEWNGREWIKKELADGESVVVVKVKGEGSDPVTPTEKPCGCHESPSDDIEGYVSKYIEYRVVNGELVDVAGSIFEQVMDSIDGEFDGIGEKVDALEEMLNSEIERSTNADSEINAHLQETDNAVAALTQSLSDSVSELNTTISEGLDAVNISISTAVSTLNQSIDAERNERTAKDEEFDGRLNAEEQARTEKDDELSERISAIEGGQGDISGKILTQEGTEYDPTTGRLMLKSRDGSNDVEVQFSFNFGTF